nr:MAG TPA: hypothetical protein [Caudoviricetes sp.]
MWRVAVKRGAFWSRFANSELAKRGIKKINMKKYLQVSSGLTTFAIARILMRSTPHKQRARRYVQARPTIF